jgi:hypothetical protein
MVAYRAAGVIAIFTVIRAITDMGGAMATRRIMTVSAWPSASAAEAATAGAAEAIIGMAAVAVTVAAMAVAGTAEVVMAVDTVAAMAATPRMC